MSHFSQRLSRSRKPRADHTGQQRKHQCPVHQASFKAVAPGETVVGMERRIVSGQTYEGIGHGLRDGDGHRLARAHLKSIDKIHPVSTPSGPKSTSESHASKVRPGNRPSEYLEPPLERHSQCCRLQFKRRSKASRTGETP